MDDSFYYEQTLYESGDATLMVSGDDTYVEKLIELYPGNTETSENNVN